MNRRDFLRGAGTVLALPWLESLATARNAARQAAAPRLLWIYVPNGIHMADWTPATTGELVGELPPTLAPLDAFRDSLRVISGLSHRMGRANGDGPGDHARAGATWLTGVQPFKGKGEISLGVSADQLAARHFANETRFASLAVGTEGARNSGQCDSGYACAYSSNVSWASPTVPLGKENSPVALFDRICRRGWKGESEAALAERMATRRSVLDYVRAEAKRLARGLGAEDRGRLDQYLDGVRGLERRIEHMRDAEAETLARPEHPRDFETRLSLLRDLILWALATDQTRVATFMFANEGSNRSYKNLEISEGHHSLSHHREDAEMVRQIRAINRYHTTLLTSVLEAMQATPVGDSNLYKETIVVYGSGLSSGNKHSHDELPLLLAGGGADLLGPAGHTRVAKRTPMMNLHLGVLAKAGVERAQLGDSTGVVQI